MPFCMYTPDRLMKEARERLDVEVSDESISEAEELVRVEELLVSRVLVTVEGDEESIVDFNRSLLGTYPEIEVQERRSADEGHGDAALELRCRPAVPLEHVGPALERTAAETGVKVLTIAYRDLSFP